MVIKSGEGMKMEEAGRFDLQAALRQLDYLNLIIVSAAAAPDRLPYLRAQPAIELYAFQHQLSSLSCLLQAHLADLRAVLRGEMDDHGHFADFRDLIADTVTRLESGDPADTVLYRHLRNLFAFDGLIGADEICAYGVYIRDESSAFELALGWLKEMLSCLECGFSLHEILGDAQNTDVCTRLCFGDAVKTLESWQRDLQLILPGSVSVM